MTNITLKNDFHHTVVRLRVNLGVPLSDYQIEKSWKTLCGMTDCKCSGTLGTRGKQDVFIGKEYNYNLGKQVFTILNPNNLEKNHE